MPLEAPNLDDRTFEDLLREARLRIPRYCREWTDFNEGDPGTALVQLFAWFTELMLYRLNQVPERNYIKFLELLNLQLRPAEPARAVVCLTAAPNSKQLTSLKSRARFEVPVGSESVFFETIHAIDLVPHPLDAVQVWDTSTYTDVTTLNERGTGTFRPFGWNPQPGSALYLGFKPDEGDAENPEAAFPDRIYFRTFFSAEPNTSVRPSNGVAPATNDQTLIWEYRSKLDPETADRWRPLAILSDSTAAFTREGTIELRSPGSDIRANKIGKPTADNGARFWIRCRFAQGLFPADRVPEIAFIRVNAVEVENLATFEDEVLGESDGFPRENDRAFRLQNTPVRPDSVEIVLEGDTDAEPWKRVDDFLASANDSKHFKVSTTGIVQFGDGQRGRVPPPGSLVIARKYLAGGGVAGNVAAGAIATPPLGSSGIETVTNPRAATGGKAEESLEELKQRAASDSRRQSRGHRGRLLQIRRASCWGWQSDGA